MKTLGMCALAITLLAAGCGDDDDDVTTDGGGAVDGGTTVDGNVAVDARVADAATADAATSAAFALTSTVLAEGAAFPAAHTCAGANQSPPLSWTAGPAGTTSYAIVFQDMSNQFRHWVIWDIPATTTSLPLSVMNAAMPTVPAGAKQARSYDNATFGYLGPCPGGATHNYRFTIYAVDVATLTNVTTASSMAQVHTRIQQNDLASAMLSGTSNAQP